MMQVAGAFSDVSVVLPSAAGYRSTHFHSFSDSRSILSPAYLKRYHSIFGQRLATVSEKSRARNLSVKSSESSGNELVPVAPVKLETPAGQLLSQILQSHPHLLPAAIDQQLDILVKERDAKKDESATSSLNNLLYKRIAEVKEKERQTILAEMLYCVVIQKFFEKEISLIPNVSTSDADPTGRVDFWPNQEYKLESIHSTEALEMIQSHLLLVLGDREVGPLDNMAQISKIKLGKLYAASIMYGYFLKRVDERFQLEQSMNTLPDGFTQGRDQLPQSPFWDQESLIQIMPDDPDGGGIISSESDGNRLRMYVMYLDAETLQKYATLRSKEAISLIEKQTQALFGRPDIRISEDGSLDAANDEVVSITFSGLTMLILEAVGFGSFLWDAEGYFIDQIPIREVVNSDEMGGDFPAKPMSVYATIWDASTWATNGGQDKVDYKFEPFASEFSDLILEGCPIDPIEQISPVDCNEKESEISVARYATITSDQRAAMKWFREKYMYYTHCYDLYRYPLPMPECIVVPSEQALFKGSGRLKFAQKSKFHRRHGKRRRSEQSRRQISGGINSTATGM